jgi:hypothetical protein
MFKFKIPDALNPRLFMQKKQTELRKRHDEWQAEKQRGPKEGEREEKGYTELPVNPDEVKMRAKLQFQHPEVDVDGQLAVAPMRVVSEDEKRRQEFKAARLRTEYNQKRGIR